MPAHTLLAAYLVVGADALKRQTAIKRLKGRLDPDLATFNLDEIVASGDVDPSRLAISLNTIPVGNGFRLVLVREANRLSKPASESIVSYLQNPNPGCVLCVEAEKLAKNTRLYKAISKVGPRSVIDCAPIKARELPSYVIKHARAKGLSVDQAAANELVSRVGEDTVMIDRQLQTLAELCSQTMRVTADDVRAHVARTAEVKPWEFLDKVAAGDARRALELYRHMQDPSHLALLALIVRRLRELVCARSLIDRGNARGIASELGKQEWQVRSVTQAARRFTSDQLTRCLGACARCERDLKSGADGETTFVRLILDICNP